VSEILLFDEWREQLHEFLVQSGMPRPQADKYFHFNTPHSAAALEHYENGLSPGDACTKELGF